MRDDLQIRLEGRRKARNASVELVKRRKSVEKPDDFVLQLFLREKAKHQLSGVELGIVQAQKLHLLENCALERTEVLQGHDRQNAVDTGEQVIGLELV